MASSPSSRIRTFEDFARVHAILLAASGLPPSLHRRLFLKLSSDTFDGGDFFAVEPCDGGRRRRLVLSAASLPEHSDVFLVDHAWSFRLPDALKQLREVPGLVERMVALMCVDVDAEPEIEGSEAEDEAEVENGTRESVLEIVEREVSRVKERGSNSAAWLELEELGIDDEMLLSLDLSAKLPVEYSLEVYMFELLAALYCLCNACRWILAYFRV